MKHVEKQLTAAAFRKADSTGRVERGGRECDGECNKEGKGWEHGVKKAHCGVQHNAELADACD